MVKHVGPLAVTAVMLVAAWGASTPAASAPVPERPVRLSTGAAPRRAAIVLLAEQADLSAAATVRGKTARARYVLARLHSVAERTQPPVVDWLVARGARVERFHIANALAVEADESTLVALAALPGVRDVEEAVSATLVDRTELSPAGAPAAAPADSPRSPSGVEVGIREIGADTVWDMGYRGEGAVVAIADTGVAWEHPALKAAYRGRESGGDYNWLDPLNAKPEPVDSEGHGTHIAGIAVGEADGRQIGVAPATQWIACRVGLGEMLDGTAALRCLQWTLAPTRLDGSAPRPDLAPDVVNASWSLGAAEICHSGWLSRAVAGLEAAGIAVVGSAGNRGSQCGTVCVPSEYTSVVAVANLDVNVRAIHPTSSRGPVPSGDGEIVKPDLAAPGVGINSSVPPNRYERRSGTSMASPHVVGAMALLLSARPDLRGDPATLRALLYDTADRLEPDKCGPKEPGAKTNNAGFGALRVDRAVERALVATPTPTEEPTAAPTSSPTRAPTLEATATDRPSPGPSATDEPLRQRILLPWVGRRHIR